MARSDSLSLFNRLETSIRNGVFKPVYFLYGKEKYLIDRAQKLIADYALEPHERDFNQSIVYGGDTDAQSVLAECASFPTMAERRLVIVREFEELSGNDRFITYAQKPNPQTVLVIVSGSGINSNPYAAISRASETFKFDSVSDKRIPGWITKSVEDLGYRINGEAATMLGYLAGSDLQTLSNEVDKLISFVGNRKSIGPDDVLEVAGHSSDFNVFALQKLIIERDFVGAEEILDRMLQVSSNTAGTAIMTVTILASYFTKLLKLSASNGSSLDATEVAKKIGVPVFFAKEYQSALKAVGRDGIDRANQTLVSADYEIKGGTQRTERLILTMMLRRLTEGKKRNIGRAAA